MLFIIVSIILLITSLLSNKISDTFLKHLSFFFESLETFVKFGKDFVPKYLVVGFHKTKEYA
jgi:hypothetical protein